ncbi:carboxypeptidase-like regulatory domain-containing protein, partial [Escherichia coli]|nr:carboxypeptidase-like regulatory domain-containing protein [Escherichia coli]MCV5148142.1 carboxypeptidase-like regulatory domain-containing protein [Escherichia coli]
MSKKFKFISGALSLLLCFAAVAFGQRTSGNIEGTVTDPNGAVVPNATVTVKSVGGTAGFTRTVTTDSNGYFQVAQVPVGTYQ